MYQNCRNFFLMLAIVAPLFYIGLYWLPYLIAVLKINKFYGCQNTMKHPEFSYLSYNNFSGLHIRNENYIWTASGHFKPTGCKSRGKVALIVPYKNRPEQLKIYLPYMTSFLTSQNLDFQIFIIEQIDNLPFNRGSLFNLGFMLANEDGFNCFIFHDVDLLPENPAFDYICNEKNPVHFSESVSTHGYKKPYENIFGGVVAFNREQFRSINGFSNCYWGWGGEDDDLAGRAAAMGWIIERPVSLLGRYFMFSHAQETPNPGRFDILNAAPSRIHRDGVNSIHYKELRYFAMFSHVLYQVRLSMNNDSCK